MRLRSAFALWLLLGGSAAAQLLVGGAPPLPGPNNPSTAVDDERAAFKAGREYVFATGNNGVAGNLGIQVPAGSYLNARICNASTTRTWFIAPFGRFLDTSSNAATPYGGAANPDALTTAQAATLTGCGAATPNTCNLSYGTNLAGSGVPQTDVSMSFGVGAMMTSGGATVVPSATGIIYPGMKNEISKPRGLPPGKCFAQYLVGQAAGLSSIYLGLRVYMYYDQ